MFQWNSFTFYAIPYIMYSIIGNLIVVFDDIDDVAAVTAQSAMTAAFDVINKF